MLQQDAVDREHQPAGGRDAQPAPPVEGLSNGILLLAWLEAQHGLVHQIEREGGLHRLAAGVTDLHVEGDRVARFGPLAAGRHGDVQRLLHRLDRQRRVAHLVRGHRLGRIGALDDDDRDVDIGRVIGRDGQAVDRGVALQLSHLLRHHAAALDRDPGPLLALEGAGDQNLGGLARHVGHLIADQIEAVVVVAPPGHVVLAADPDPGRGLHQPFLSVPPADDDLVGAALLRREGDLALGVLVGGERVGVDQRVLGLPLPGSASARVLDEGVDPLAAVGLDVELLIRQALGLPIDGHHVHAEGLASIANVLLRRQADVEIASMDNDVAAPGDGLSVLAVGGRLDGQPLPRDAVYPPRHHSGGDVDAQMALSVGGAGAGEEWLGARRLLPPAPAADPGAVLVGEIVAPELDRIEGVGGGEHAPRHLGVGDGPAEEVAHVDIGPRGLPGGQFLFFGRDDHLELRRAVGGDGEGGLRVVIVEPDGDAVVAQRGALVQRQLAVERTELIQRQPIVEDLLALGVVDADLYLLEPGHLVADVVLGAEHAPEVDRLPRDAVYPRAVDGPVGGHVGAVVALIGAATKPKVPRADALLPLPTDASEHEGILRDNVEYVTKFGFKLDVSQTALVGGHRAHRLRAGVVDRQRETTDRLTGRQVGRPGPQLPLALFDGQVVVGDGEQLAVQPGLEVDVGRGHLQQIKSRLQPAAAFGQGDGRVRLLVEGRLDGHRPLAERHTRRLALPEALLSAEVILQLQAIEAQVEPADVDVADGDLRRLVGVIGADHTGHVHLHPRIERGGAELHRHLLARGVAVGIGDVRPDAHLVVGAGFRIEVEAEGVVVSAERGVDPRWRDRRRHLDVGHDGGRIDGRVEDDLEGTVRVGALIAVARAGAHDARQRDGGEAPFVSIAHALAPSHALHPGVDPRRVDRIEGQLLGGREDERVGQHVELAVHRRAASTQAEGLLRRGRVDGHVELHLDDGLDRDQITVFLRRDPGHLRRLGGEGPLVGLLQQAAGGVGQSGLDAGGVVGAAGHRALGREGVDRGVDPLALALNRRIEADRLRQVIGMSFIPVARIGDCHQRHDRAVEHHGDGALGLHVLRLGRGDDLRDLQVADGAEAEAVGAVELSAIRSPGLGAEGDVVVLIALEIAGWLEMRSIVIGPFELTGDVRADLDGLLHRGLVHRAVEDQLDGAVGGKLLPGLRRALDDSRRDVAGRRRGVGRRRGGWFGRRGRRRCVGGGGCQLWPAGPQQQTEQCDKSH